MNATVVDRSTLTDRRNIEMANVIVEPHAHRPVSRRSVEYVERKGRGHPDSICDAVMESVSVALSKAYVEAAGRVLHHNIDKGMLVAGQTCPQLGGGEVEAPMRLVVGDRATDRFDGTMIPVHDVVDDSVRHWFKEHLRFVNPRIHLTIQNELRPGSAELVGIYDRAASQPQRCYPANDTSAVVGFAPLSETEHLVLAAEHFLNSAEFKHEFPETGEDVKVMGVRQGRVLQMTVAMAFIDKFIWEEETYFHRKAAAAQSLQQFLETKLHSLDGVNIQINALDELGRGLAGMYLTVLGTSAESGDGGQVGRGNRASGLISFCRPMSMEAVAGKNPVSHVGKVYNLLAFQIADRIQDSFDAVEEAYVWLCSRIGRPLDEPWSASVELALASGATIDDVQAAVEEVVAEEILNIGAITQQLTRGELAVC
jgi:S-adenosylmethionine synthetase